MFGKSENEFFNTGTSAEDSLKIHALRFESHEKYEIGMYREAARRVIFHNCMTSCEIDHKTVPNFNRNFYYNQKKE